MIVFFDTTETKNNPTLEGANWVKVGRFLAATMNEGYVADIVVQETANHVREDIRELELTFRRLSKRISRLTDQQITISPEVALSESVDSIEQRLRTRLGELHIQAIPYGDVNIGNLVKRALERRKPFDFKGHDGFRDSIQWEVILRIARDRDGDQIVIVTNNKSDFGKHGGLAGDLRNDLVELDCENSVTVCAGLHKFVEEYVNPSLTQLEEISEAILTGTYEGISTSTLIARWWSDITETIYDEIAKILRVHSGEMNALYTEPTAEFGDYSDSIKVQAYEISSDLVSISISFIVPLYVECSVHQYHRDDEWGVGFDDSVGQAIVELSAVVDRKTSELMMDDLDEVAVELDRW